LSGAGIEPREASWATPATARATARQGLNARKTSPNSTEANASPTQKTTYTNVGTTFAAGVCTPAKPAQKTTNRQKTPTSPQNASITDQNAGCAAWSPLPIARHDSYSSFGLGQKNASRTNETTSAPAAPHPNSHSGMGTSAFWATPCARTDVTASP
jgi:hypothetical protein